MIRTGCTAGGREHLHRGGQAIRMCDPMLHLSLRAGERARLRNAPRPQEPSLPCNMWTKGRVEVPGCAAEVS